jgi:hypothetical protein
MDRDVKAGRIAKGRSHIRFLKMIEGYSRTDEDTEEDRGIININATIKETI